VADVYGLVPILLLWEMVGFSLGFEPLTALLDAKAQRVMGRRGQILRCNSLERLSRKGNLAERREMQCLRPKVIYIAMVAGLPKEDVAECGSCLLY
jgi:hypothetical protein